MADDPYKVLKVSRAATHAEIRASFIKLAKKYHPDVNAGDPNAEERFKRVNLAYADLTARPELSEPGLSAPVSETLSAADVAELGRRLYGSQPEPSKFGKAVDEALSSAWSNVKKTLFSSK